MQVQPLDAERLPALKLSIITVFAVTEDRVPQLCCMDPQLMGSASVWRRLNPTRSIAKSQTFKIRSGRFPCLKIRANPSLSRTGSTSGAAEGRHEPWRAATPRPPAVHSVSVPVLSETDPELCAGHPGNVR